MDSWNVTAKVQLEHNDFGVKTLETELETKTTLVKNSDSHIDEAFQIRTTESVKSD